MPSIVERDGTKGRLAERQRASQAPKHGNFVRCSGTHVKGQDQAAVQLELLSDTMTVFCCLARDCLSSARLFAWRGTVLS